MSYHRRRESSYQRRLLIWLCVGALILVVLLCIGVSAVLR